MWEFKRSLSPDLLAALEALAADTKPNWWTDVLDNEDLLLAVRGGYLNAYHRGQSLFRIGPGLNRAGQPIVQTHFKYLLQPTLADRSDYVTFDGEQFELEAEKAMTTAYEAGGHTLKRLIGSAKRYAGAEKSGVHEIAKKDRRVIDVEIAFSDAGEADERATAPRMDLAVLVERPDGVGLALCEAKCADNGELWTNVKDETGNPSIAVVQQVGKYETFIRQNREILARSYVDVCRTLARLRKVRGHMFLDPLVRRIAESPQGEVPLQLHEDVYLLVYGYDGAQKDRVTRHTGSLGLRVIAKGDPGRFKLGDDILRTEKTRR